MTDGADMYRQRLGAMEAYVSKSAREISIPKNPQTGRPQYLSEIFGSNVFSLDVLAKHLPKPVFKKFVEQLEGRKLLDQETADAVAHAVRVWAQNKGATHFTHWFQPQTGSTAEKHDSFLTMKYNFGSTVDQMVPLDAFSGSQLLQAEPDASSFPHGGMRTTFEARGYTVWNTTSPMFIRPGPHETSVLYIPSVFISYNGQALDEKTILLRSCEAINQAAIRVLHLMGHTDVKRVITTLGCEQEFFMIDRKLHVLRPDLDICGRTIVGALPPKHQQMEDHYFGQMPSRILATIAEAEIELAKLGVPIKTRHNEVAPRQYEMAPMFEEASLAVEHNLLTMEVLTRVAHKHGLKVLFHEKPFKGVNGSGKHCNWSLATDTGINLLNPEAEPEKNLRFLVFCAATLHGVHRHASLLRASIAAASNDHRLGGHEAPPGIISAFMGAHLNEVLNAVKEARPVQRDHVPHMQSVKLGGTVLDVKVSSLPEIARDLTDRNRTSPFAFTGNKFEFRAVGAKQSPSFPVTIVNSAVAASLQEMAAKLEAKKGSKAQCSEEDVLAVVREYIAASEAIRFEGDGYTEAWRKEAEKRGLPMIRNSLNAIKELLAPANKTMLTSKIGILTEEELESRYHVLTERYGKDVLMEADTLRYMVRQFILPAIFDYRKQMADGIIKMQSLGVSTPEVGLLATVSDMVQQLTNAVDALVGAAADAHQLKHDHIAQADMCAAKVLPAMHVVRGLVDRLEETVPDPIWPFPKYHDILL